MTGSVSTAIDDERFPLDLGPTTILLPEDVARSAFAQLRARFGPGAAPALAAVQVFADDDPIWARHSGGTRHLGPEWQADDVALALGVYAAVPPKTRVFLDLLMDRGGQRPSADDLAAAAPETFSNMYAIAAAIKGLTRPCAAANRRYPFVWWRGAAGSTRYSMKVLVARLFRAAREAAD